MAKSFKEFLSEDAKSIEEKVQPRNQKLGEKLYQELQEDNPIEDMLQVYSIITDGMLESIDDVLDLLGDEMDPKAEKALEMLQTMLGKYLKAYNKVEKTIKFDQE